MLAAAFFLAGALFLAGTLIAQGPAFEVASIRARDPNAPGRGAPGAQAGAIAELGNGRYATPGTVYSFILKALGLQVCSTIARNEEECPYITGGPDWIRKDGYQIRATLPEGTPSTPAAIAPMLEALLRDRFQLKFHHEMREAPVFLLTVAKGEPKVRPAPAEGRMVQAPDGTMRRAGQFTGPSGRVGPDGRRKIVMTVRNYSMPEAAKMLTFTLKRAVLDRTGLTENFDWELDYVTDADSDSSTGVATGPEFFTAIREQAGLRLESAKEKVDVIVIDSVERPSEN